MDKRLIGRKFMGNFGSLPGFGNYVFCLFPKCREVTTPKVLIE
jgi:hypothetical protein